MHDFQQLTSQTANLPHLSTMPPWWVAAAAAIGFVWWAASGFRVFHAGDSRKSVFLGSIFGPLAMAATVLVLAWVLGFWG